MAGSGREEEVESDDPGERTPRRAPKLAPTNKLHRHTCDLLERKV